MLQGLASLIFWTLTLVVVGKWVLHICPSFHEASESLHVNRTFIPLVKLSCINLATIRT